MSATRGRTRKIVCAQYGVKDSDFNDDGNFDDLPFKSDSLDKIELLMAIEEESDIDIEGSIGGSWVTVQDVIDYVEGRL